MKKFFTRIRNLLKRFEQYLYRSMSRPVVNESVKMVIKEIDRDRKTARQLFLLRNGTTNLPFELDESFFSLTQSNQIEKLPAKDRSINKYEPVTIGNFLNGLSWIVIVTENGEKIVFNGMDRRFAKQICVYYKRLRNPHPLKVAINKSG